MMRRRLSVSLNFISAGVGFGIGVAMIVACGIVLMVVFDSPESAAPHRAPTSCRTVAI